MWEAFNLAISGSARRRRFFFHIALVLVVVSMLRGNNWLAIVSKVAFVAFGYLSVFLFELYKGYRVVAGKPQLDGGQLWRRFLVIVGVLSVVYIGSVVGLAFFAANPDGLALLFPFYCLFLLLCALPFFWQVRDLRENESQGNSI